MASISLSIRKAAEEFCKRLDGSLDELTRLSNSLKEQEGLQAIVDFAELLDEATIQYITNLVLRRAASVSCDASKLQWFETERCKWNRSIPCLYAFFGNAFTKKNFAQALKHYAIRQPSWILASAALDQCRTDANIGKFGRSGSKQDGQFQAYHIQLALRRLPPTDLEQARVLQRPPTSSRRCLGQGCRDHQNWDDYQVSGVEHSIEQGRCAVAVSQHEQAQIGLQQHESTTACDLTFDNALRMAILSPTDAKNDSHDLMQQIALDPYVKDHKRRRKTRSRQRHAQDEEEQLMDHSSNGDFSENVSEILATSAEETHSEIVEPDLVMGASSWSVVGISRPSLDIVFILNLLNPDPARFCIVAGAHHGSGLHQDVKNLILDRSGTRGTILSPHVIECSNEALLLQYDCGERHIVLHSHNLDANALRKVGADLCRELDFLATPSNSTWSYHINRISFSGPRDRCCSDAVVIAGGLHVMHAIDVREVLRDLSLWEKFFNCVQCGPEDPQVSADVGVSEQVNARAAVDRHSCTSLEEAGSVISMLTASLKEEAVRISNLQTMSRVVTTTLRKIELVLQQSNSCSNRIRLIEELLRDCLADGSVGLASTHDLITSLRAELDQLEHFQNRPTANEVDETQIHRLKIMINTISRETDLRVRMQQERRRSLRFYTSVIDECVVNEVRC